MKRIFTCTLFLFSTMFLQAQKPVNVIFDTDMGPDYDDAGAIAMLHAFADSGKANILATIASTNYDGVAAVLNVFNTYFKRPEIPVGVPGGNARDLRDGQHWSDTLRANYPHEIKTNSDATDAVALYRKVLAAQPDHSVTIITVGFFTNIAGLLRSEADQFSKLGGKDLVNKKVDRMVSMAGKFPAGLEFNIEEDKVSAKYALENFPRPLLFSGFEIGEKIVSGLPLVLNEDIQNSPVKDVFRISIPLERSDSAGRKSWDETAVLAGIAGYAPYYSIVPGSILIDGQGNNTWANRKRQQYYLVEKMPPAEVEKIINRMMMHQPK